LQIKTRQFSIRPDGFYLDAKLVFLDQFQGGGVLPTSLIQSSCGSFWIIEADPFSLAPKNREWGMIPHLSSESDLDSL
jgi:hypothetical protein